MIEVFKITRVTFNVHFEINVNFVQNKIIECFINGVLKTSWTFPLRFFILCWKSNKLQFNTKHPNVPVIFTIRNTFSFSLNYCIVQIFSNRSLIENVKNDFSIIKRRLFNVYILYWNDARTYRSRVANWNIDVQIKQKCRMLWFAVLKNRFCCFCSRPFLYSFILPKHTLISLPYIW